MLYNNGRPEPMGLINNPLAVNLYSADTNEPGHPLPPSGAFIITEAGDFIITETGDRMITE